MGYSDLERHVQEDGQKTGDVQESGVSSETVEF